MKILATTGRFLPDVGGMQYSTHQTLLALQKEGAQITLLCPTHARQRENDEALPYEVHRVGGPGYIGALKRLHRARREWRPGRYDHLLLMGHYEECAFGLSPWLAPARTIVLAAGTRLPFGTMVLKGYIRNRLLCRSYSRAHRIIAISPATQAFIQEHCSVEDQRFRQVPRPVDESIWARRREKRYQKFVIGTVSRLEKAKNIQGILSVVESLRREGRELEYWIFGDGPYRPELEQAVAQKGIVDSVVFQGSQDPEYVAEGMQDVDLFLLLSMCNGGIGESFGRVYVEAAALKVPSIGYATSGVVQAVEDGVTGILCAPGDDACVLDAVRRMMDDKAYRKRLGCNAEASYRRNFTLEQVGKKLMRALYD